MTALAEALLAAQRQAIGALSKAYVAGAFETDDDFYAALEQIGALDAVDRQYLVASLDVLKTYGAPAPRATQAEPRSETATPAQLALIARVFKERNIDPLPDAELAALTKTRASELIDAVRGGTYDPAEYLIPF